MQPPLIFFVLASLVALTKGGTPPVGADTDEKKEELNNNNGNYNMEEPLLYLSLIHISEPTRPY